MPCSGRDKLADKSRAVAVVAAGGWWRVWTGNACRDRRRRNRAGADVNNVNRFTCKPRPCSENYCTMDLLNELGSTDIAPAVLARVRVRALFEQHQAKLTRQDTVLAKNDFKMTALPHQLAYYRQIRFGKTSGALASDQRLLFGNAVNTDLATSDAELDSQGLAKRAGHQSLPHIEHRHEPASCQCGQCGDIRPQCACQLFETFTAAPVSLAVTDGVLATVGPLAWLASCKYLDHFPMYRIGQIAARQVSR